MKLSISNARTVILVILAATSLLLLYWKSNYKVVELRYWTLNRSRNISHYLDERQPPQHIPPDFCKKSFVLIMVLSTPYHICRRTAIRAGWGNRTMQNLWNVSVVFLLGAQPFESVQIDIERENRLYNDIIQDNFLDSYDNLTLKSVTMLKWFTGCDKFEYLLKVDQDLFVNIPRLVEIIKLENRTNDILMGSLFWRAKRVTNTTHKWYSPEYMFSGNRYPVFLLGGAGYIMSKDVAKKLYKTALATDLFHIEDVFLTGICAKKANITPRSQPSFYITYGLPKDLCFLHSMPTVHGLHHGHFPRLYTIMDLLKPICTSLGRLK